MHIEPKKQSMASVSIDNERISAAMSILHDHWGIIPDQTCIEIRMHVLVVFISNEFGGYYEDVPSPKSLRQTKDCLESFLVAGMRWYGDQSKENKRLMCKSVAGLWANSNAHPLAFMGFDFSTFDDACRTDETYSAGSETFTRGEIKLDPMLVQDALNSVEHELRYLRGKYRRVWSQDKPFHNLVQGLAAHWRDITGEDAEVYQKKKKWSHSRSRQYCGGFFVMVRDLCQVLYSGHERPHYADEALGKAISRILNDRR